MIALVLILLRRPLLKMSALAMAAVLACAAALVELLVSRYFRTKSQRCERVAVIGGGIAGFGAAHSLCSSGMHVELFEACPSVGGNAKTHAWPDGPVTGLSVLAWPPEYFRNYGALLRQLRLPTTSVTLRFFVRRADGESFMHSKPSEALAVRYARDLKRWARLVATVRACNAFFAGSATRSLYHFSLLNPMNVVPLRWLCRLFGVSAGFWSEMITPLHCTTFLTTDLASIPSVVVTTIDDLIPIHGEPQLESWVGSSREVFDGVAARAGERLRVHVGSHVETVEQAAADGRWTVRARTAQQEHQASAGSSGYDAPAASVLLSHGGFDRVVFASNAQHAASALPATSWLWWGVRKLLETVEYSDAACPMFRKGLIHSDASVLPSDARAEIMSRCCNYLEQYPPGEQRAPGSGVPQWENTFILSSWYPSVRKSTASAANAVTSGVGAASDAISNQAEHESGSGEGDGRVRLVSYGLRNPERVREPLGVVENYTNHPSLTPAFLAATMLLRVSQGQRGVYFCGSMATPGNGHDLSLCSGLAVAAAIGAGYPFSDEREAAADLARLRKILGV